MSDPRPPDATAETPRLLLRPPRPDDLDALHAIQADAEAMRFTWRAPDREATRRFLEGWGHTAATEGFAPWTVVAKQGGEVLGWGGLGRDPDDPRWGPEVLYFLRPEAWGRGLATELVEAALADAFGRVGLAEVGAFARPGNHASRRVLEKCGFRRAEFVPAMERDRWSITAGAWRRGERPSAPRRLVVASDLEAAPGVVWRHAISPEGVNHELGPLLRMTFPAHVEDLTAGWRPGEPLGRSWLRLGGALPVEFDDLAFVEVEPGRRFLERSRLLTQRLWEHERCVEPTAGGTRLTDRLAFVPRVGWLGPLHAVVFRAVFAWRHRRLRQRFGGRPA